MEDIILTDKTGKLKDFNLTAHYNKMVPLWIKECEDELLITAKKDYPSVSSIDDVIQMALGTDLRYLAEQLKVATIYLYKRLLIETRIKFTLQNIHDFKNPKILAFDAAKRLEKGQGWSLVKSYHCESVEVATLLRFWCEALKFHLEREKYGGKVVALALRNDEKAFFELSKMIAGKFNMTNRSRDLTSRAGEMHYQKDDKIKPKDQERMSLVGLAISQRIEEMRKGKEAEKIKMEYVNNLPTNPEIVRMLKNQDFEDAKIISDAVIGNFRFLKNEVEKDYLNAKEALNTEKEYFYSTTDRIDAPIRNSEKEGASKVKTIPSPGAESAYGEIDEGLALDKLEKTLNLHKHRKLKPVYAYTKQHPGATNTEIAENLKMDRKTVRVRRMKIKIIYKELTD